MRDAFPFSFHAQTPKSRKDLPSWYQNTPKRFDNIKNERQSSQLNYGVKHQGNLSSYLDGFKRIAA